MSLKYYWLIDEIESKHMFGKCIDLKPKKWSTYETHRPWEPRSECVAPAIATTDQTPEDIEFTIVPVAEFFGDDVLDDKTEWKQHTAGLMRTAEHEINVEIEEALELESYPFDEQ
eukprot:368002_1